MYTTGRLCSTKKVWVYPQKKIKRYQEQDAVKVLEYLQAISEIPKEKLVYVDETGIDSYLYRTHCYAPKGIAAIGRVSGRKYRRVGIVAAQRNKHILAPLQYDGTMDARLFETWFETRLMRELPLESVIVMDNAAFHRKKRLHCFAENHGHRIIFLPPYSPELNPIENFWAVLKNNLRKFLSPSSSFDEMLCLSFQFV